MRLCAVGKGGRIGPIGREIARKLLFSKEYALEQVGGPKKPLRREPRWRVL
jgi:hypothetical protein